MKILGKRRELGKMRLLSLPSSQLLNGYDEIGTLRLCALRGLSSGFIQVHTPPSGLVADWMDMAAGSPDFWLRTGFGQDRFPVGNGRDGGTQFRYLFLWLPFSLQGHLGLAVSLNWRWLLKRTSLQFSPDLQYSLLSNPLSLMC